MRDYPILFSNRMEHGSCKDMAFQVHEAPMMAPAIREPRSVIQDEEIEVDLDLEERPREAAPEQIEPAEPTRAPVEAEACCLRVLD